MTLSALVSSGFSAIKARLHPAREYFEKALTEAPDDKAARLMLDRCIDFIQNPPEKWDGAITFHTK